MTVLTFNCCDTGLGVGQYLLQGLSAFNAVSTDGSEIFFTVCLSGVTASSSPHQVFVCLGGSKTLEVSKPLGEKCESGGVVGEVPCNGAGVRASADFAGASEDGSRVFFTTEAPLVEGDKDAGNDLYMAEIGCAGSDAGCGAAEREVTSLIQVSHDPNVGQSAEVQGVVRVAPDGSRVYFVARGVLTGAPGPEGRTALQGADNLYVYDSSSGTIAFVGDLCSGQGLSGTVEDLSCPSATGSDESMWTNLEREAAASPAAAPEHGTLYDLAIDNDPSSPSKGDVYVVDLGHNVIDKFSASGKYLYQLTGFSEAVLGVAVDTSGDVWIALAGEPATVEKFDDSTQNIFLTTIAPEFGRSPGIAVDSEQNIYLLRGEPNVAKFSKEGATLEEQITVCGCLTAVAVDPSSNDLFTDQGSSIGSYPTADRPYNGSDPVETLEPVSSSKGVAVNGSTHTVYATEQEADAVAMFKLVSLPRNGHRRRE